ncbi:MAG: response regulator [Elusimicrobiota bacterium]
MVVDDDESFLDILEVIVKREGFRAARAVDGREALRMIDAQAPDLILLDFMMPGLCGFEVLKELQSGDASKTPVVVITGRNNDPGMVEMVRKEPNVYEYLKKPIKQASFGMLLHQILGTRPPDTRPAPARGPLSSAW